MRGYGQARLQLHLPKYTILGLRTNWHFINSFYPRVAASCGYCLVAWRGRHYSSEQARIPSQTSQSCDWQLLNHYSVHVKEESMLTSKTSCPSLIFVGWPKVIGILMVSGTIVNQQYVGIHEQIARSQTSLAPAWVIYCGPLSILAY